MLKKEKLRHNTVALVKTHENLVNNELVDKVLHETKKRNKCGVVLKLDFEKAYDKVCWNFLVENLKMRQFNDKWCA